MTHPRKVKSKKSQGKVRRPWAICTDCKKMKDKLAEKDALLREALEFGPTYKPELKGWVSQFVEWQKRIRESLGGGNG